MFGADRGQQYARARPADRRARHGGDARPRSKSRWSAKNEAGAGAQNAFMGGRGCVDPARTDAGLSARPIRIGRMAKRASRRVRVMRCGDGTAYGPSGKVEGYGKGTGRFWGNATPGDGAPLTPKRTRCWRNRVCAAAARPCRSTSAARRSSTPMRLMRLTQRHLGGASIDVLQQSRCRPIPAWKRQRHPPRTRGLQAGTWTTFALSRHPIVAAGEPLKFRVSRIGLPQRRRKTFHVVHRRRMLVFQTAISRRDRGKSFFSCDRGIAK